MLKAVKKLLKIDYIYRCNLLNNIGGKGGKMERGLVGVKSS